MGNHAVGRCMAAAAEVFWLAMDDKTPTKERALAALDTAAKNFHGADAEFDDELHQETPLSRLVAIAFDATPEEIADRDGKGGGDPDLAGERWYEGPQRRFSARYQFC